MADILIVDDDEGLRASLAEYLELHGFSVRMAEDGAALRRLVADRVPDLVVLDLNLPRENGLSLARWLREATRSGILMLTVLSDPLDRVAGIEIGADDYMAKPFHPRELLARVRAILRRLAPDGGDPGRVRFGRCVLDTASGRLIGDDGTEQRLTGMELDLLKAFAVHPNQILSRERLLDLAHNREWDPFDRSVDVRITRIRRKIEADPAHPQVIRTVRGAGYIFEPGKGG